LEDDVDGELLEFFEEGLHWEEGLFWDGGLELFKLEGEGSV
jgi:hypothetical protein